jgi:hypothetical protein
MFSNNRAIEPVSQFGRVLGTPFIFGGGSKRPSITAFRYFISYAIIVVEFDIELKSLRKTPMPMSSAQDVFNKLNPIITGMKRTNAIDLVEAFEAQGNTFMMRLSGPIFAIDCLKTWFKGNAYLWAMADGAKFDEIGGGQITNIPGHEVFKVTITWP